MARGGRSHGRREPRDLRDPRRCESVSGNLRLHAHTSRRTRDPAGSDPAEESRAMSVETELSNALAAEISRAESAEAGLDQRIDDALSNVDFSQIDSISEVLNTFYQKVTYNCLEAESLFLLYCLG